MNQELIDAWCNKDLWSEKEFAELCCGLEPHGSRENTVELNHAEECIRRAVISKSLSCICPSDTDAADRLYGHARFFTPPEAISWGKRHFEALQDFPDLTRPRTNGSWPWGEHETDLLRALSAAVEKFWNLYDPNDQSTAPTNEQVSDWLQNERGVSARIADTIATIIRADGLRTGPRK